MTQDAILSACRCGKVLLTIGLLGTQPAYAADCLQTTLHKLAEFSNSPATAPAHTSFRLQERFVICLTLQAELFVTIWDAPPLGELERLFPNARSHPDLAVRAVQLPAGRHCYGTTNSNFVFPLVQDEGPGSGKITVQATPTIEKQPDNADYAIPGRRLSAAAQARVLTIEAVKTCDGLQRTVTSYQVTK